MTEVIVLSAAEAEKVRGRSPKMGEAALDPVPTKDGRFYLGPEVLDDPSHEDVRGFLRSMPLVALEKLPRFSGGEDMPTVEVARLTKRVIGGVKAVVR